MTSERDERFMRRALELAAPHDGPRPAPIARAYGAMLVVREDRVLGEASDDASRSGAVEALRIAGDSRGATLYLTGDPAPEAFAALVEAAPARIVRGCPRIGLEDDPLAALARAHGIAFEPALLADEASELLADQATVAALGRPLVELKSAVTLDGRIATRTGDSKWITSETARIEAHRLRAYADAVLVGVGTVITDDPRLDTRLAPEALRSQVPIRIVVDTTLRLPLEAHLVRTARSRPTWIAHGPGAAPERVHALRSAGVSLIEVPRDEAGGVALAALLATLAARGVARLLVEGGARLAGALLDAGLVDRAAIFVAPVILGDAQAPGLASRAHPPLALAHAIRLERPVASRHGPDMLVRGRVRAPAS